MFDTTKAFSGYSVDDIEAARRFYGETLGVEATVENGLLALHLGPDHDLMIYPKDTHEPATFTVLNFPVEDIDRAVDELTESGVTFLRYDGFSQDDKGISRGTPPIAWFADPAGNVISVLEIP